MSLSLNSRERRLVVLGGLALSLFLVWTFILEPGLAELRRLDDSIAKHERDVKELLGMARELRGHRNRLAGISGVLSVQDKGFSLAGRIEEELDRLGLKKALSSLQPLPPQKTKDDLTRAAVEIKLKGFAMASLVKFLYWLEHSEKPLGIPRFTLVQGRKGLEASLRVETLIQN